MTTTITSVIEQYLQDSDTDIHHRYLSWDHCQDAIVSNESISYKTLHLAFYLASWGMYRGSSGLLQKNFEIHRGPVEIYHSGKYDTLKCSDCLEITEASLLNILGLKQEIADHYQRIYFKKGADTLKPISATDTLMSKIILGLFGCVPAYDEYLIKGLQVVGIQKRKFNIEGLKEILNFYNENLHEIESCRNLIQKKRAKHYPAMKIIDMYFWQLGYNKFLEEEQQAKAKKNTSLT
ncbi:hypothetical protein FBD94_09745 [Pedobacter hiemivivus]|uniref:Uncharacterized protein n=1 Tax=Pedobacter hiemivivus TaxID=2530454 RepID=A0A4U1GEV8_9SPHI|nr:hypothetical protein [Pedobacter hiemivivus]TKC62488.1 hypothetical protein FBD94_09745 [Pedobacter hiemivivus]